MKIESPEKIYQKVYRLLQYKQSIILSTNAIRVINGEPDGFDGITADYYDNSWQIQVFKSSANQYAIALAQAISLKSKYTVIKWRTDPNGLSLENFRFEVFNGDQSKTEVYEGKAKFIVDLEDSVNTGLFLDMRHMRLKIAELASNLTVCNGFSYTCSFGVQALLGGAKSVTNIDISQKILNRGKLNYQCNNLDDTEGFLKGDSIELMKRFADKNQTFDLIIMDPPTFARRKGGNWKVDRDLEVLSTHCLDCLEPSGYFLFSTNCSRIDNNQLGQRLGDLARKKGIKLKVVDRITQDIDFTPDQLNPTSHLAGFVLQKKNF